MFPTFDRFLLLALVAAMTITADDLVSEQLWQTIQPLLPAPGARYGGRRRVDDRAALAGIVYQLRTGISWRLLPTRQLGCGSPVTWRLRAGVWEQLHHRLLDQLGREGQLDWSQGQPGQLQRARQAGAN